MKMKVKRHENKEAHEILSFIKIELKHVNGMELLYFFTLFRTNVIFGRFSLLYASSDAIISFAIIKKICSQDTSDSH